MRQTQKQILTHQLNDLDEHPVVGRRGHKLKKQGCKGKIVLRVPSR